MLQEIAVTAGEESGVLCFHLRRGLIPWVNLDCNTEMPVAIGEEHEYSGKKLR